METMSASQSPAKDDNLQHARRRSIRVMLAAFLVISLGMIYILLPSWSEGTDNAYVDAQVTSVAPKVRGLVAEVLVNDNQFVHLGEPLLRIDSEEFDARFAAAQAELADAEAGVSAVKAELLTVEAEDRLAKSNVRAAESRIRSAVMRKEQAVKDKKRYLNLVESGAVSAQAVDQFNTAAVVAEQELVQVKALSDVSVDSLAIIQAKRATVNAALQKAEANLLRAKSALQLAEQDRRHTVITAPIDGIVGNKRVQIGDYVQPGSQVLTLVPVASHYYVTANFKETQISNMSPGMPTLIKLDAYPEISFIGQVESFAPGSGSRFALLPFEPGTGNFTKIVQRIPVRIRFEAGQPGMDKLRPGLSAKVNVKLRQHFFD
jgi:membrane fusion protein (multidrug efflux system)